MNELTRQTKFTTENADIAKGNFGNILRKTAANHLGLIKMATAIKIEYKQDPNEMEQLKQNNSNIFEGISRRVVRSQIGCILNPQKNPWIYWIFFGFF